MSDNKSGVEQYAAKSVLIFSGSLLVLSVSLNNAGFGKVVEAWAESIVRNIEVSQQCEIDLSHRIEELEKNSHPPTDKSND